MAGCMGAMPVDEVDVVVLISEVYDQASLGFFGVKILKCGVDI